jgi:hypothetical protein
VTPYLGIHPSLPCLAARFAAPCVPPPHFYSLSTNWHWQPASVVALPRGLRCDAWANTITGTDVNGVKRRPLFSSPSNYSWVLPRDCPPANLVLINNVNECRVNYRVAVGGGAGRGGGAWDAGARVGRYVCARVHVCARVCVRVCARVCVRVCVRVCMHMCARARVCARALVRMRAVTQRQCTFLHR